jgi:membrane-bound ClpP family serine protease
VIASLALALLLALQSAQPAGVPAARKASVVAILPIRGEIDALTVSGLATRVAQAQTAGADAIVLQLDTPGGDMLATLELCRQIKAEYPPNTVAWIKPRAYSAGVITALACREIVVAPHAVLGDAAPIAASPLTGLLSLPAAERAKLESPLLSEVTDSSRRAGHDERLARAFVAVESELWLLEDAARDERYVVDANEYRAVFGEEPPRMRGGAEGARAQRVPEAAAPDASTNPAALVPFRTNALRQPEGDAAAEAGERNQSILPGRRLLTAEDRPRLRVISQIDAADELLTLQADEAIALRLAAASIADESELRAFLGAGRAFTIEAPWSEALARVLTSWWMRTLLVAILVVCFFGEMSAPGLGMFSLGGILCVSLLAGGSLLAGLAQWWPAILIVAGLALVAIEILLLPGTLLAGALGAAAFVTGVIGLFIVADPTPGSTVRQAFLGIASLVTSVGGAAIASYLLGPRLQWIGPWKAAVHHAAIASTPAPTRDQASRIGAAAVAATDLRPVGKVDFDGARHDARSEGGWISAGAPVRILRMEGNEMIVEQIT